MAKNNKAKYIGQVLIASSELDTKRGQHKKLQNILGESVYYKRGNKWYYDIEKLNKLSIPQLKTLTEKIMKGIH